MIIKQPLVSITTVNYNGKKYLKRCFDSLYKLNYPKNKLEIIMVDNCSSDGSIDFVKSFYRRVKVIQNDVNNYCKAINLAINVAEGEYVALINNDTKVHKDWLIELVKVIAKDKTIGAVGSKILYMDGRIQNAGHYELPGFYWGERGAGREKKDYSTTEEVLSLCGAAILYRKKCFERVGLFDEDFIMYGEDVDMALRLRNEGWRLVFVPRSIIHHVFHGTANEELSRFYIERNRLLFLAKHYPKKLSSALIGSGYFTAKKDAQSCGKLYSLLPQVILTLIKHHNVEFVKDVLSEIFEELRKTLYYENDILTKEINNITDEKNGLKNELSQINIKLNQYIKEMSLKESRLIEIDKEFSNLRENLNIQKENLIAKENLITEKDSQLKNLNERLIRLDEKSQQQLNFLQAKDNLLTEREKEVTDLKQGLADLKNEFSKNLQVISEKDIQLNELRKQLDHLNQQLQQYLDSLSAKDNLLAEKERDLTYLKDEFSNLSNQLKSRMDEVLIKDGQLIESKVEINTFKDELSRLAEELATKLITIEEDKVQLAERESELKSYRDELSNLSNQLRQRMDEVLIKDGQLIEKDTQITSLTDQIAQLNQQLQQYLDSLSAKDNLLTERERNLSYLKDELSNLSGQLKSRMDEVLTKDGQLIESKAEISALKDELSRLAEELATKLITIEENREELNQKDNQILNLRNELDGIYSSEGFRFVLRPLWSIIWNTRNFLRLLKCKLGQFIWFLVAVSLSPLFLFLAISFFIEKILWSILSPILNKFVPKRKLIPFEDLKVSLVIPNWNGIDCLKECLPSIFSAEGFRDGKNEVLVIDDGSTDDSVDYIRSNFPQVRLILNKRNKGFGFTCNRGVKEAKNELIVLINNDIIVTKNFLEPLISHLRDEDVFAVTPKLYAWDRKTFVWGMHMGHFEDGYIRLWNEAETGNGDKIHQPSPSIFAIGGAMVFRKRDFLWLDGFDEIYRPNCWEDIDISYRAWKRGLKVIYEPNSLMYHKGKSNLTYERHKEIKNEISFTWKNVTDKEILREHLWMLPWHLYKGRFIFLRGLLWAFIISPKTLSHRFMERRFIRIEDKKIFNRIILYYRNFMRRGFRHCQNEKPNCLIISRFISYPLNTGGKIRIHNLAKLLSDKYNFSLLSLIDHEDELKYIPELKKVFSEVYPVLAKSPLNIGIISRIFYPNQYKFGYSYSQELIDKFKEIQKIMPLDLVQIESNELLYLVDYIKYIPTIYTEHDISILTFSKSYYQRDNNFISSIVDYLKRFYFHISKFKKLDRIITLSREDERVLWAFFPKTDITLVPTGVDLEHFSFKYNSQKSKKLIFIGHYRHYPNEDAIVYFSRKIFPLIRKQIADAELLIVGSNPTPKVEDLAQEKNVTLIGEVSDVKPYLDDAAVFVNSVHISAGIKGKVLEAMACGVPVVSTTIGSYGIDALPGRDILIADNPHKFAKEVIKLLSDDELRKDIAIEARRLVEKKYNWLKIVERLGRVYKSALFEAEELKELKFPVIEQILDRTNALVERKIEQLNGLMRPEEGPEELHIELTYHCDSKCIMCDLWDYQKRFSKTIDNELSLDEIRRFIEESQQLQKTKVIVLSGGEPFLRRDIVDVCGFFSKHLPNSSIGILTNAMSTDDIVAKTKQILDKFHPKSLWLGSSLDGLGKEHDMIRGSDGAFLAFNKTIERCKKELPEVELSATFTLTPYNIDQLIPAKEFADKEGLNFFAQFVVPKEAREKFIWTESDLKFVEDRVRQIIKGLIGNKDYQTLINSMDKCRDNGLLTQLYYWSHFVEYQSRPQRFFKKCIAGSKFAMFNPYGDLFFCPILKEKIVGNIREEKFDHLWMSERAQGLRTLIERESCHCWLVCIVFPLLEKVLNSR